MPFAVHCMCLQ